MTSATGGGAVGAAGSTACPDAATISGGGGVEFRSRSTARRRPELDQVDASGSELADVHLDPTGRR